MATYSNYSGVTFNRKEVKAYIESIPTKDLSWVQFLVVHNTGAPSMAQHEATKDSNKDGQNEDDRMRNAKPGYAKWQGRGPHFWVFKTDPTEDKDYGLGTPLPNKGVHSPSWNTTSIGVEMVADFDGTDDPHSPAGANVVDNTAYLFATLLAKLGKVANGNTIRLHKEDKKTTHDCPGKLFKKDEFIAKVQKYMGVTVDVPKVQPPQDTPGNLPVYNPGEYKFSDYCVTMMKRIEGLRLTPYNDRGTLAIGYGHNASSGQPPKVVPGMVITEKQAHDILIADMTECLRYLKTWVKVPLTQGMVDAMILFIFQQGATNFRKKMVDLMNAKKHWTVAKNMEDYVFKSDPSGGLDRRFELQADMYRGLRPTKW